MAEVYRQMPGRALFAAALIHILLTAASPALADPAEPGPPDLQIDSELSAATQRDLAERFAPVLVFHPSEQYFPTSPLFPLEHDLGVVAAAAPGNAPARLGNTDQRRDFYEGLSLPAKANLASVYYRGYHARVDGSPAIVVEYWLYYVQNTYRVRGNLFPFWVDSSHPNDLEHIHVVLTRDADGELRLRDVYSSAHHGTMPANRHRYSGDQRDERIRFIVELGSHAVAPDIDGDGVFTPGKDGSSGYKMLWGIRDRGITWARYRSGYMDSRDGGNAVVFEYAGAESSDEARYTYRLAPVEKLATAFDELRLTKPDRKAIFESNRSWFRTLFGGDNGTSAKLLVPPARSAERGSIGIDRFGAIEQGFYAGAHLTMEEQGAFAGVRYSYLLGGTYVPDLAVEAEATLLRRRRYAAANFLVSYPIDGSTRIMVGKALVTDSLTLARHQWDWVGAVEFPLGHMRVHVASRSWGPITRFSKEVRLSYSF